MPDTVPMFDDASVTICGPLGDRNVPALVHPWCPGLAVTMGAFGTFDVTHVPTGRRVFGSWERWGNALRTLVEVALIARAAGADWSVADRDVLAEAIRAVWDQPVPFPDATSTSTTGVRPLTIREWWGMQQSAGVLSEFPWESPDDAPEAGLMELMEGLRPLGGEGAT